MPDPVIAARRQLEIRKLDFIEPLVARILTDLIDEVVALREQVAQKHMEQADIASHERWAL